MLKRDNPHVPIKAQKHQSKIRTLKFGPQILELMSRGYTHIEIAKQLNLTYRAVTHISERAAKLLKREFRVSVEQSLDRIELQYQTVIKECFMAFERSKVNRKNQPVKPDIAYIDRILESLEALRKLKGLDKAPQQQQTGIPNAQFNWYSLVQAPTLALPPTNPSVTVNDTPTNVSAEQPSVVQSNVQPVTDRSKDDADILIEQLNQRAKELGLVKGNTNEQSTPQT